MKKTKNDPKPKMAPVHPKEKELSLVKEKELLLIKENELLLKEKTLVWIFSILSASLVFSGIAFIIENVYRPDINALKATADKLLIGSSIVRPEPMEAMLFRVAVVVIPLCLLGFYRLFSKNIAVKTLATKPVSNFLSLLSVLCIVALVFFDFTANNPFSKVIGADTPQIRRDFTTISNFGFYFDGLFLGSHLLVYTFILIPLICILFFKGIKTNKWGENKFFTKGISIIGYAAVATVIIACIAMSTFNFPYTSENKYDINAVYYSMTQVYAGLPMLVGGFTNTYGLYPHFLNLIFQIIGLSIFKFSFAMALLLGLSFVLNFYCLKQFVNNKIILFLGMLTVIFFPFLDFKFLEHFDASFAFHSVRYIIPSVLLALSTIYLKKKSPIIYWTTFFIMALFVLWNPEFGIVCYISWILFLTYAGFYDGTGKPDYKHIVRHWLAGAALLIAVFYAYKFTIYLFYGSFPDMMSLWVSIFIFGKLGFGLLPMKLIHPWNIVALILMLGFLLSIAKWYKKENDAQASILFLLSVLGVGFFFYFQGRSHNWNLAQSSGMCLMLLTILGDKLWDEIKNKNVLALNALFVVFLYIISFSFFEIVTNTTKLKELVYQEEDKAKDADNGNTVPVVKDFILDNSQANQKIYILTLKKYQALFFDGARRSAFNPGMIDLFYNSDLARLENQLVDSSFSVFITPVSFYELPFMARPLAAMGATYEFAKSIYTTEQKNKELITLLNKRKTKIPSRVFFDSSGGFVVHRKYTDDRNGAEMRINDAIGLSPVNLNPEFSVSLLFDSKDQVFATPTIIGNMPDSNGFVISRVLSSPNCLFGINGMGYYLPVPDNQWVYCVMNVFPDHFDVYVNGERISTKVLPQPIRNSKEPLCIGNLGSMHYYVGAISEVAITNKAIDSSRIKETWNQINETLSK